MRSLLVTLPLVAGTYASLAKFERNLAFRSPFLNDDTFGHDIKEISRRSVQFSRRDTVSAASFKDDVYPGFYTPDNTNAPSVWSSGVNFTHAVASGDPYDTSIILWTRAVPLPSSEGQLPLANVPVCVSYKISTDENFKGRPADSGEAFTSYDVDFTVKVEATGLKADTHYFYQFADCTNDKTASPVGRTRTLASPNTPAEKVNGGKPLTFSVNSCSNMAAGWFNAYGYAAHKVNPAPDVFIHLGDYMYESAGGGAEIGRLVEGRETATIVDYRFHLEQYRNDPDLKDAHQNHPWIVVWWDDHEIANNGWKSGTSNSNDSAAGCKFSPSGACFTDRKMAGTRAYHEWMPIRQVDVGNQLRIWRNFQIGKLLDLTMLDTRNYDRDVTDLSYNRAVVESLADNEDRSLMGKDQEQWLATTLSQSKDRGAIWRVIGQQIVFSQVFMDGRLDFDAWDGYRANRNRIVGQLYEEQIDNVVILSGDSHANWVSDVAHPNDTKTYDPSSGKGAMGVEFAGPGVTSASGFPNEVGAATNTSLRFVEQNPDLQWSAGFFRGFFTITVDTKELNATFYAMKNITTRNLDGFVIANFNVKNKANHLTRPVSGGQVHDGALKPGNH